jgi:hypothetical protein
MTTLSAIIVRAGGRSSIPETVVINRETRDVLDAPPSRSMTAVEMAGFTPN